MHTSRYAIAGLALVASTIMISCGSDNNSTPTNSGNTPVGGSTLTTDTLAIADTAVVDTTLP